MRLKQAQEIRDASIEGLETCAFCDYSVILPPDIDIIFCLNPECKKETCRLEKLVFILNILHNYLFVLLC